MRAVATWLDVASKTPSCGIRSYKKICSAGCPEKVPHVQIGNTPEILTLKENWYILECWCI